MVLPCMIYLRGHEAFNKHGTSGAYAQAGAVSSRAKSIDRIKRYSGS